MRPPLIFVSYRRSDTGPFALALRSELELRLDGVPLFLDVNRIQGGDLWANVLEDALTKASILIALIGSNWIGEADGRPARIEGRADWVRQEVARALRHPSGAILPVLVNGASLPEKEKLPKDLKKIWEVQTVPLRVDSWDSDMGNLCRVLAERFAIRVKDLGELLPTPDILKRLEEPLSDKSLDEAQRQGLLNGWEVEVGHDLKRSSYVRESLRKRFVCDDDVQAFEFVNAIMPLTASFGHHPMIEMTFKWVVIRLSTFDAGHRITTFDRRMAVAIDEVFNKIRSAARLKADEA